MLWTSVKFRYETREQVLKIRLILWKELLQKQSKTDDLRHLPLGLQMWVSGAGGLPGLINHHEGRVWAALLACPWYHTAPLKGAYNTPPSPALNIVSWMISFVLVVFYLPLPFEFYGSILWLNPHSEEYSSPDRILSLPKDSETQIGILNPL